MFLERTIYMVELDFSPDEIDTYSVLYRRSRREYIISKDRGIKKSEYILEIDGYIL